MRRGAARPVLVGLLALVALVVVAGSACQVVPDPRVADLLGDEPAVKVTVERDVPYGAERGCPGGSDEACGGSQELDVHRSPVERGGPRPVLVWLHGGGWVSGDKADALPPNVRRQLRRGYDVVSVNYRLAPQHRFPVPLLDVKLALRWVAARAAERGWDHRHVIVAGHSAGGHLAVLAALTQGVGLLEPPPSGAPGGERVRVAGAVSINGILDPGASARRDRLMEWFVTQFAGCTACPVIDAASPGWWVDRADPPVYLVTGAEDPFASSSQALQLCLAATLRGSRCAVDVVDTGPRWARGHFSFGGMHQVAFEEFLDAPGGVGPRGARLGP